MDSMTEIFETLDSGKANKTSNCQSPSPCAKKIAQMKFKIQKIERIGRTSPNFKTELLK